MGGVGGWVGDKTQHKTAQHSTTRSVAILAQAILAQAQASLSKLTRSSTSQLSTMAPKIKKDVAAMTKGAIAQRLATEFTIKEDVASKIIDSLIDFGEGASGSGGGGGDEATAAAATEAEAEAIMGKWPPAPAEGPKSVWPPAWLVEHQEWLDGKEEREAELRRRLEQEVDAEMAEEAERKRRRRLEMEEDAAI